MRQSGQFGPQFGPVWPSLPGHCAAQEGPQPRTQAGRRSKKQRGRPVRGGLRLGDDSPTIRCD